MVKSKKKKISISFSEKYTNIYDYLKTKDNISSYICELVMKDLESPSDDEALVAKIEEVVERMLKDKQFIVSEHNEEADSQINQPSKEDVAVILDLF